LALADADGNILPLAEIGTGEMLWVGTSPGRPPVGPMTFTGYVVVASKGAVLAVYSDCGTPAESSCQTIVVDVNTPIPPPVGDPLDVCREAVAEAGDSRARSEVEQALDEFESTFKSVHYDRCFGAALRESFRYQAQSREYHYTLRYYDQAGNLVQTVPPEGVAPAAAGAPAHRMLSKVRYDSLENIVSQTTPDTGERIFIYDRARQLRFSQNAQQRLDGLLAYVKYDALGRSTEVGLIRGLTEGAARARVDEAGFPGTADGGLEQVARTIYDTAAAVPTCAPIGPRNLRGRVAAAIAATSLGLATVCYSYDVEGRTSAVLRDLPGLEAKVFEYDYDALTGRVAAVHYQRGQPDALHTRLRFNRLNQLETVESSRDEVVWERDARYTYYAHGPLARLELGADRVQGLDYTYTIDGRPKGLNTGTLTEARDPGHDGLPGGTNAAVARDAVGQTLEFFAGDYVPVGAGAGTLTAAQAPHASAVAGATPSAFALASCAAITVPDGCGLYEGNLARSVLGLAGLDGFARVTGFAYRYDRLYRLTESSSHDGLDPATHLWPTTAGQSLWRNLVGYDANGNIRSLSRFALSSTTPVPASAAMDDLAYRYATDSQGRLVANRLEHVNDSVADGAFPDDLDDQGAYAPLDAGTHNYAYDANGNLVRDRAAGITAVLWSMDNRITRVVRGTETLEYVYDALGQRFAKVRKPAADPTTWETEHFVRDEQGNLVATYRSPPSNVPAAPVLEELYLRGATPLGVIRADRGAPTAVAAGTFAQVRGDKQYQVANYLGHVLATVSDRKVGVLAPDGSVTSYAPQILSTTDYDPFGAPSPGRFNETDGYRFGFNSFERDDELKGPGNSYYARDRLFDPRLGRWLSPDPVQLAYASPYAGFSNNPLRFGDPRGQLDWDSFKDTMENVAITARDIQKDTLYVFSGAAAVNAITENLVKAKASYDDNGQISEAIGHAIGIQDAIESLAQKDLDWQEGGATVDDRVRMGIGEVSGMNDVSRAVTGETEFAEELSTAERLQLGIQGGVKVVSIAAEGASIASSALRPRTPPAEAAAPKPSVKTPDAAPCPLSFGMGTVVWTPAGLQAIESLDVGDSVLTLHPEGGWRDAFRIEGLSRTVHQDGVRLVLDSQGGRTETLTTTSEHPFWSIGSGWIAAGELQVGDELASRSGNLRIREWTAVSGEFEAYNLSIGDAHTYLVGELGAWVHNCGTLNGGKRMPSSRLAKKPAARGRAPIGDDGHPVELHHRDQTKGNLSKLDEKTRTEHRGKGNFQKNHQNTGQSPSAVDRAEFNKMREEHWKSEWDRGRFDQLPND
jgi:RHS repeat-associated protein